MTLALAGCAVFGTMAPTGVTAQVGPGPDRFVGALVVGPENPQTGERRLSPGAAAFTSAILPGTSQFIQGEDRWIPYVMAEAWSWLTYFRQRSRSRESARDYRDLAWTVARRVSIGERRDTVFEYYETLSEPRWQSSGSFDSDLQLGGVQPETDASTFNGDVWRLARALQIPGGGSPPPGSADYELALQYYLQHAIPPGYAWAWGPFGLEQQRFRELIRESDDAARAATLRLGILLANRFVSAIDGLILARVREGDGGDGAVAVRLISHVEGAGADARWVAAIRLSL
jgi:hypothetical protein